MFFYDACHAIIYFDITLYRCMETIKSIINTQNLELNTEKNTKNELYL